MTITRKAAITVAIALALLVVGDLVLLALQHHYFAMLISNAFGPGAPSTSDLSVAKNQPSVTTFTGALTKYTTDVGIAGAPVALAGGGVAWMAGHKRGVGIALTAAGGLALAVLAPTLAH